MGEVAIKGVTDEYRIVQKVGQTKDFTIYFCRSDRYPDQLMFFKIVTDAGTNSVLDREAMILRLLRDAALQLEQDYEERGGEGRLNYQLCFPEVVESFVTDDSQGRRRVLISRFEAVPDLRDFISLQRIRIRDRRRVDPRTSAWILGKTLKIIEYAHGQNASIGNIGGDNILIIPDQHYVAMYDWSNAEFHQFGVPEPTVRRETSATAKEVILLLGGDLASGAIPEDDQLFDERYQAFLLKLARQGTRTATRAHKKFYGLIDALWERSFHPFTTYPLD